MNPGLFCELLNSDGKMQSYVRLSEERRNSRRTVADVISVLSDEAGFAEDDHAEIRIGCLTLPSTEVVGLVQILFRHPSDGKVYVVYLPTSTCFLARRPNGSRRDCFSIEELDGATFSNAGIVLLNNGLTLRAVEVVPCRLPEPTELDWRIVHHTISIIRAEGHCYRDLRDDLPPNYRDMVPDLRVLDCSRLSGLTIPLLKVITSRLREREPTLRNLSDQKIADALRDFGMRIPARRSW
jgi:hypothetical protein